EEERGRIAKDLHDSLGSLLATIKGHSSALEYEVKQLSNLQNYQKTNHLIDEACDEVRRISHNMMPQALISNGLVDALRDLTDNYASTSGWKITFDVVGMKHRLSENYELMIFRIVQELMANIARHAVAQQVLFQMIWKENNLHITVEDDGRGFKLDNGKESGLGMRSIRSRVAYLNGEVEIDSVPGEGTTVSINIPIKNESNGHRT
ncbi:MAG: sensor histidine kinase, partial [Saprospiraceae bacterium]|nr:sensor histidine kinase [Saprospiraceae bacterium]